MTRDELVEKMARAICCVNGCLYPRACDMEMDTAQQRLHEASAALSVVTEWLEGEDTPARHPFARSQVRRLITMLKEPAP